jgi:hypothetical protein
MATKREKRDPYLWEALISILGLIVLSAWRSCGMKQTPMYPFCSAYSWRQ